MPDEEEVAWLHLLKQDTWMTANELLLAAHEASMVNLALMTAGLSSDAVTGIMRGFCAQGKAEEKEVLRDRGQQPAWKLAGEQPEILPEAAFIQQTIPHPAGLPA